MDKVPEDNQTRIEKITDGVFSNLPPRIEKILDEVLTGKSDPKLFLESIEGIPGSANFLKRLRNGTLVKVLRSSGEMDHDGWVIDREPEDKSESKDTIRVHNKQRHLAKMVPLVDLIRWNR